MSDVTYTVTQSDIHDSRIDIPIEISVRLLLNSKGFKFEDDKSTACIVNTNPKPIGIFSKEYCYKTHAIIFKQII